MSQTEVGVVPVVERGAPQKLLGLVTQFDLLSAREKILQEERHRERVLKPRLLPGARRRDPVPEQEKPMPEL